MFNLFVSCDASYQYDIMFAECNIHVAATYTCFVCACNTGYSSRSSKTNITASYSHTCKRYTIIKHSITSIQTCQNSGNSNNNNNRKTKTNSNSSILINMRDHFIHADGVDSPSHASTLLAWHGMMYAPSNSSHACRRARACLGI